MPLEFDMAAEDTEEDLAGPLSELPAEALERFGGTAFDRARRYSNRLQIELGQRLPAGVAELFVQKLVAATVEALAVAAMIREKRR